MFNKAKVEAGFEQTDVFFFVKDSLPSSLPILHASE